MSTGDSDGKRRRQGSDILDGIELTTLDSADFLASDAGLDDDAMAVLDALPTGGSGGEPALPGIPVGQLPAGGQFGSGSGTFSKSVPRGMPTPPVPPQRIAGVPTGIPVGTPVAPTAAVAPPAHSHTDFGAPADFMSDVVDSIFDTEGADDVFDFGGDDALSGSAAAPPTPPGALDAAFDEDAAIEALEAQARAAHAAAADGTSLLGELSLDDAFDLEGLADASDAAVVEDDEGPALLDEAALLDDDALEPLDAATPAEPEASLDDASATPGEDEAHFGPATRDELDAVAGAADDDDDDAAPAHVAPHPEEPSAEHVSATATAAAVAAEEAPAARPEPVRESRREPVIEPPPAALAGERYLAEYAAYRSESRKLANAKRWREHAEMVSNALRYAQWAAFPEVRSSLLTELARIYEDALGDSAAAERTFIQLAAEDPTNREALSYLDALYRKQENHGALHDLYAAAVERTWDPAERLELTRQAVALANGPLSRPDLAIRDWEHLWQLGETSDEVAAALSEAYRTTGRWDALARFIASVAEATDEAALRRVHQREMAEIYVSALRQPAQAAPLVDGIRETRPLDPLALLLTTRIAFQSRDFDQLAALSRLDGLREDIARDIRRVAADALWQAGERELAVDVYERLLQDDAEDRDALRAKETFFTDSGNFTALCAFLEERAERAERGSAERRELLERAATIAETSLADLEHAIALWHRVIEDGHDKPASWRKLVDLYEALGNKRGVATSLEGLLAQTAQPAQRVEILARLGELYAHDLGDDDRAEQNLRALLNLVPGDTHAQAELAEIYARRGDFDALDQTLRRQIASADDDQVLELVHAAARNLEEHLDDDTRSAAAWEQVLDYDPRDTDALDALARHLGALERKRERLAALELRVAASPPEDRIAQCLALAEDWLAQGARAAAIATWERILRWEPTHEAALAALESVASDAERGAVRTALELAANLVGNDGDEDGRIARLHRTLDQVGPDDHALRAALLTRLIAAGDVGSLAELRAVAQRLGQHEDVAGILLRLASEAPDAEARAAQLRTVAALYENELGDATRAYAAIASIGFDATLHDAHLPELERLCRATDRLEDLLAIHDGLASASFEPARRRSALDARATLLEKDLEKPARAFEELRRLLALDPQDHATLARAETLAREHGLTRQLRALYGELWDRATDDETRARVAAKRHALVESEPAQALEELLLRFRVTDTAELRQALIEAAESLDAWAVVLPRLEAAERALETPSVDALSQIASLYETRLSDADRALELLAEALCLEPTRQDTVDALVRVATAVGQHARLAQALRAAAARTETTADALALYRRVASLYLDTLAQPERAVDIHRRILRIEAAEHASIDALITWHRDRSEWSELRDRLGQRVRCADAEEDVTAFWMEIAAISRDKLEDPEGALEAYSKILAATPEHEAARQGVADLTGDSMSPEVQARRLRLELRLASPEQRVGLMLELAALQDGELKRTDAAQKTLTELVEETGAAGPGFAPLAALLERREAFAELTELLERHADALLDGEAPRHEEASAALRRALELCDEHGGTREDAERIARKLRALEPDNRSLLDRLAQAMRASDRWEELASLLEEAIASSEDPSERLQLRRELARVLDLSLGRSDEARALLEQMRRDAPHDLGATFHLASLALRRADIPAYIAMRKAQAERVDPLLGALVHCHLAEVHDEQGQDPQVAAAYRAARALDKDNQVAGDALRALGRRNKNWRQSAALLPEDGEHKLSFAERSQRLAARAQTADSPEAALDWLNRAIAVDPDNVAAWRALAGVHHERGSAHERFEALLGALSAFERSTPPAAARLVEHARLLHDAAEAARATDDTAMARQLDGQAFTLAPSFAPAALAMADAYEAEGNLQAAFDLYDQTLGQSGEGLDEATRAHAVFRRGALAARLGDAAQAIDDLRATVRANPLHLDALDALATLHDSQGHPALALANLQQALVVARDREARGRVYYRLGQLWEDGVGDADEAGPYYELAIAHGAGDSALMKRALDHYRRDGRVDEALAMVTELTQATEDPKALATLWITRGEILEKSDPEQAIEAFDMALSYEPGHGAALDGLERMLAAANEWEQVADLLEGRIEGAEARHEQAAALQRLADLCEQQLGDVERANAALRRLLEIQPSAEAVNRLLANLGDSSPEERQALLEHAIDAGGSRFDRAIELARLHLARGRRHQAWAILSPLRVVIHLDSELKDILNDLRQEFERAEPEAVLSHLHLARLDPTPAHEAISDALTRLREATGPLTAARIEDAVQGAVLVAESTPNGKVFAQLRDAIGVPGAELYRAADLPEDFAIVDGETPVVCLKTEIFQKASRGELFFWLALAVEQAAAPVRTLAAQPAELRPAFVPALVAALDLGPAPHGAEALVTLLRSRIDATDGLREELAAILEPAAQEREALESFWLEARRTAERVAGLVVFDLRSAWRALSRLDPDIVDQRNVKSVEDVNALFDSSETMGKLLRFYVTDAFGSWLA